MSFELPPDELAQLADAGGGVVGAVDAEDNDGQDTVHPKISLRCLLIALWLSFPDNGYDNPHESKALFECDEEFRAVVHSQKQIQRIAEIAKCFPRCKSDVFFSCVGRFVTNESYLIRIPT